MKLIDNLYCYIWAGRGNNCNSYLFSSVLRGDRPHVLIDPGHIVNELNERCLDNLLSSMKGDGFEPEDIGLIINTHSHVDHCEANQVLVEKSKAKGSKGKAGQALITLHKDEDEYRRTEGEKMNRMFGREVRFEPNFYLKEGDLSLGKESRINLQILLTPGHSPGSICIYWIDNKVLITGDVVFYAGVGRTDFPSGDGKLLKQSVAKLAELDVEYLLPGHSTEYGAIIQGKERVKQNFALIEKVYFPLL